ncbi:lasso peptide biosynthesis B2 protein [Magnetococcales bacterium HHB-1]
MTKLIKFFHLSRQEKQLLTEAFFLAAFFSLIRKVLSSKQLFSFLGTLVPSTEQEKNQSLQNRPLLIKVQWAVHAASHHLPWSVVCLPQALAARIMLKRRGLESRLFIGMKRDHTASLKAHAWLKHRGFVVTGNHEYETFQSVSSFR